jgi:hypothetical protein
MMDVAVGVGFKSKPVVEAALTEANTPKLTRREAFMIVFGKSEDISWDGKRD